MAKQFKEPCLCGAHDCPRCFPENWEECCEGEEERTLEDLLNEAEYREER